MNRLPLLLIALLLGLSTLNAAAAPEAYRVKDVPNVQLTDRTRFVSDPADAIRPTD